MRELEGILKLDEPTQVIEQLTNAEYAFACWRLPNTQETHFIISMEKPKKVEELQIATIGAGFLVNEYAASHPIAPYFISADIILKNDEIHLGAKVNANQIDEFKSRIGGHSKKPSPKEVFSKEKLEVHFEKQVANAVLEINKGTFEKVVLSRYKDEPIPAGFSPWKFFQKINEAYERAFCSMFYIPRKGLWIGATPELLISDSAKQFKTVSLAGTKALSANQKLSEIAWTQKEIEEQAFVSRYIINCFKKIRLREFHEHGPKTVQAGHLAHLKTEFVVDYKEVPSEGIADQMLTLLHPTSAVCGMPIEKAKPWLQEEEEYDRSFYSGFLGPVNIGEETNLFVNLRCMRIDENSIRFYAGAGITEDSDPHKEFVETEMKMNVLRQQI